jgi:hypothetical protein
MIRKTEKLSLSGRSKLRIGSSMEKNCASNEAMAIPSASTPSEPLRVGLPAKKVLMVFTTLLRAIASKPLDFAGSESLFIARANGN